MTNRRAFRFVAAIAASMVASAAFADPPVPGVAPATGQDGAVIPGVTPVYAPGTAPAEVRLTPEQVRQVLDDAARRRHEPAVGRATVADEEKACPTKPHGEMGMEAGTGGYGAVYGTTVVPLGCNAAAAISIGSSTWNGGRYRRR